MAAVRSLLSLRLLLLLALVTFATWNVVVPHSAVAQRVELQDSPVFEQQAQDAPQDGGEDHKVAIQAWTVLAAGGAAAVFLLLFFLRIALGRVPPPPAQEEQAQH